MLVADPKIEKLSIEVKDSLVFTDLTVGTAEVCHLILQTYLIFCVWELSYSWLWYHFILFFVKNAHACLIWKQPF